MQDRSVEPTGLNEESSWKREHQIALACAIAIGLFFGFIAGLYVIEPYGYSTWRFGCSQYGTNCTYYIHPGYWLAVSFWGLVDGVIAAALVYISQLLRS
jgi:hypothetical protein